VPKLTVEQVMRLQGLPNDWIVTGGKTARYKQVAQAFPPPLAEAVGREVAAALGRGPR
jgi:DNA (cytosine-5)-methyltransferase 1